MWSVAECTSADLSGAYACTMQTTTLATNAARRLAQVHDMVPFLTSVALHRRIGVWFCDGVSLVADFDVAHMEDGAGVGGEVETGDDGATVVSSARSETSDGREVRLALEFCSDVIERIFLFDTKYCDSEAALFRFGVDACTLAEG